MGETIDGNIFNIYSDKVHISFEPKSQTSEGKKEESTDKVKENKKKENEYGKSKVIAILLALFLGRYGIHKFYLGKPGWGFVYLIFSRFDFMMFLSICDAFVYLFMNQDKWLKEYGTKKLEPKKKK